MISVDPDGSVVYRASNKSCVPYPVMGDETFKTGVKRNFQAFKPLDFLAEVTQLALSSRRRIEGHIPNKGEHQIRFYSSASSLQVAVILIRGEDTGRKRQMNWRS
jgi:hypothetical protein